MLARWFVLLMAATAFAHGVEPKPIQSVPPAAGRRLALVVGIQNYTHAVPLLNPLNDARSLGDSFAQRGYDVTPLANPDLAALELGIENFMATVQNGDVVVLYYSGHGIQLGGENYLLPTDFVARDEREARDMAYPASRILNRLRLQKARVSVVILDACRDNPFLRSRGPKRGLARMEVPATSGMYIAFAAAPGGVAFDSMGGEQNGLFAKHLLAELEVPNRTIEQVFNEVRRRVYDDSRGRQLPWTSSSMMGDFRFGEPMEATTEAVSRRSAGAGHALTRSLDTVSLALQHQSSAPNFHVRATLRLRANDIEGALEDLKNALTIDPHYTAARRERARVYLLLRDPLSALADVDISLRSNANDSAVRYLAALSYALLGRHEDAWRQLTQIIASEPAPADAYALRATINLARSRHSEAAEDCRKAVTVDPDNRLAQEVRARLVRMKIPLPAPPAPTTNQR